MDRFGGFAVTKIARRENKCNVEESGGEFPSPCVDGSRASEIEDARTGDKEGSAAGSQIARRGGPMEMVST
jgi:hypothetical protein